MKPNLKFKITILKATFSTKTNTAYHQTNTFPFKHNVERSNLQEYISLGGTRVFIKVYEIVHRSRLIVSFGPKPSLNS